MKNLFCLPLLILIAMTLTGCGNDENRKKKDHDSYDDLVKRDGLYYKKFSDVPFSGKITGLFEVSGEVIELDQGMIKDGMKEGAWFIRYSNGQLSFKGNYKNDKEEGAWIAYYWDGQVKAKGNYKNGKKEGAWIAYFSNGQLSFKGNYKNDKEEGTWVGYGLDGRVQKERTGTFKNGVKIR